jgi:dihydroneopterin aldolase
MDDSITLEGMVFFGYHGTRPEERSLGQPFVVDVTLRLDLRAAGARDDLAATVDYSAVHRQARAIVEGPPLHLTEAVAERIAAAVLAEHAPVREVTVRVRKPNVRLDDTVLVGSVVEITRRRERDDSRSRAADA